MQCSVALAVMQSVWQPALIAVLQSMLMQISVSHAVTTYEKTYARSAVRILWVRKLSAQSVVAQSVVAHEAVSFVRYAER